MAESILFNFRATRIVRALASLNAQSTAFDFQRDSTFKASRRELAIRKSAAAYPTCDRRIVMKELQVSNEKKMTIFLLCYFFGILGLHRLFTGKIITGLLMLLTFGGMGGWWVIDMVLIISGNFKDREGKLIKDWV